MKSINLSYLLAKNKIDLKFFCIKLNILSYDQLVKHCAIKKYNCDIPKHEYLKVFLKKTVKPAKETVVEKDENKAKQKKVSKPRRPSRKSKTKKVGNGS